MNRRLRSTPGLWAAAPLASLLTGCTQDPIELTLRSLERSGAVAFVCLGAPASGADAPRPLSGCNGETARSVADFVQGDEDTGAELPHLYALVTQTTRGELAVIDLNSEVGNVLDQDPATPGPNFLPIGAQPVDIVATPGGTAAFVTTAEAGRSAIFAIPSNRIRPCAVDNRRCTEPPPTLSSWPACRLPAQPGAIVIAFDPPTDGGTRGSCDGGAASPAGANGDLALEQLGRQKLVVALAQLGQPVIIDTQSVLDLPGGALGDCTIERLITLSPDVPPPSPPPPQPTSDACVSTDAQPPLPTRDRPSTPSSLWLADDRIYVGDLTTPKIHVFDAESACDLRELPPLLPISREDPTRAVVTNRIAASSRLGPGFKRYVYAIDVEDRSLMVFDVSDDSTSREPLLRPNAAINPLQPPDRLRFAAAPKDLIIVEHDDPARIPASGFAPYATRCNPDPNATRCDETTTSCDVGTLYRTSGDYDAGAGPLTLRGTFAFVALSNGEISVIDIDDYDSACRAPTVPSELFGCDVEGGAPIASTDEVSCNVFVPHAERSASYVLSNDQVGRRQAGLATFPLLYRKDGTVVPSSEDTTPRLRAVLPEGSTAVPLTVLVGNDVRAIDGGGSVVDEEGTRHAVAMNLAEPRVHRVDEEWSVTYEGVLAGLGGRVGSLDFAESPPRFVDAAARYCARGVQGQRAIRAKLEAQDDPEAPTDPATLDQQARALADRVTIIEELPGPNDPWWERATCSFQECLGTFGEPTTPQAGRDVAIVEAYAGELVLETPAVPAETLSCCFPTLVRYEIRGGGQWVVTGNQTGFLHHVVEDPETGVCRDSCDPRLALLTGRALTAPGAPVLASDPFAFQNPVFRFAITAEGTTLVRDLSFRFTTQGRFAPLTGVLTQETTEVLPQVIRYLPSTGELAVADGALEGLMLLSTRTMQLSRQFF